MAAAFKGRGQPDFYYFQCGFEGDQTLTEAERVGVVVLPGKPGAFDVPAEGTANAFDLVRDNCLPVAGTAQHDGSFAFTPRDGLCGGTDEKRVIDRLIAVRAEVADFMTEFLEERLDLFFVIEAGVVGCNRDFHLAIRKFAHAACAAADRNARGPEWHQQLFHF